MSAVHVARAGGCCSTIRRNMLQHPPSGEMKSANMKTGLKPLHSLLSCRGAGSPSSNHLAPYSLIRVPSGGAI
jgi:hypothetical protein